MHSASANGDYIFVINASLGLSKMAAVGANVGVSNVVSMPNLGIFVECLNGMVLVGTNANTLLIYNESQALQYTVALTSITAKSSATFDGTNYWVSCATALYKISQAGVLLQTYAHSITGKLHYYQALKCLVVPKLNTLEYISLDNSLLGQTAVTGSLFDTAMTTAGHLYVSSDTSNTVTVIAPVLIEGQSSTQGVNPTVYLQISRDSGHTWGERLPTEIGRRGEFTARAEWRRLGQARAWAIKLRMTDPVKFVLVDMAIAAGEANQ